MNTISSIRSAARRRVRTLTNNPLRGSMNFGGFVTQGGSKRSVRRLMKRDPANAQGTPENQLLVENNGIDGRTGATSARTISKAISARPGAGKKRIRDRGTNTRLRKG